MTRVGLAIGRLGRFPERPVKQTAAAGTALFKKKILIVYAHFEDGLNTIQLFNWSDTKSKGWG